jgi:hypothetical protein
LGPIGAIVLAPGQSFTFSFTTPATLDAGTVTNKVTVAGMDERGHPTTATDTASAALTNVPPSLTVDKSAAKKFRRERI